MGRDAAPQRFAAGLTCRIPFGKRGLRGSLPALTIKRMECLAGNARRSLLGIGFVLLVLTAPAPAQVPAPQLPEDQTPWASSYAFDLEPTVARASLDLLRPNLHVLYDAIARSYGVKLVFDPDLAERPVGEDIHLQDATFK